MKKRERLREILIELLIQKKRWIFTHFRRPETAAQSHLREDLPAINAIYSLRRTDFATDVSEDFFANQQREE